jgi:ELWxxDGT repeat protein
MIKPIPAFAALAAILWSFHAIAAVSLLKDINPSTIPGSAGAANFVTANGLTFFLGYDATYGQELWCTDGTSAGTRVVRDIAPGNSSPGIMRLTVVNNVVYFFASDGVNGVELWRSDGTLSGTHIVADIKKGPESSIPDYPSTGAISSINGILYFAADDGTGLGLWRSDGTDEGTYRVSGVTLLGGVLQVAGGQLFFEGPGGNGGGELWTSDGTAAGTKQVSNIFPAEPHSGVGLFTATSSGVFFVALDGKGAVKLMFTKPDGSSLHLVSDLSPTGGSNGVVFMAALGADVVIDMSNDGLYHADLNSATLIASKVHATAGFQTLGSRDLFSVGSSTDPSVELWTTDGTPSGTHRLGADLELRSVQAIGYGSFVVGEDGFMYFAGLQFTSSIVYSIWRTDGTDAGTSIFTQAPGTPLLLPISIVRYQGKIFFSYSCNTAEFSGSYCLWASDGTSAGTKIFLDPTPDATVENFSLAGGSLFFTIDVGQKLFISDGTAAGSHILATFATETVGEDSQPSGFTSINGQVAFIANDGIHGYEIWLTDKSSHDTRMLTDLNPGPGDGVNTALVAVGNHLIFGGSNGAGEELWVTDGTAGGTKILANAAPALDPWNVVVLNGVAYFPAADATQRFQPWRSDGTVAGTYKIADTAEAAFVGNFRIFNGKVMFFAQTLSQWWTTDGTAQGTRAVTPAGSASSAQAVLNGLFYYIGITNGADSSDLWVTDGTVAGTHLAVTVANEALTNVYGLSGRMVLQTMSIDPALSNRAALFGTDGTTSGTTQVALDSVYASVALGSQLIYSVLNSDGNSQIRTTDGTVTGTRNIVKVDGAGTQMAAYKGAAIFSSSHFLTGAGAVGSIWRTDGTTQGTHLVESGVSGTWYQAIDNTLYFQGGTEATGQEPFVIDELSPNTTSDQASTPADTAVTVDVLANDGSLTSTLTPSSVALSISPKNGSASIDPATGKITYTPAKGFSGTDTFAYIVADTLGRDSAPTSVAVIVGAEAGPPPGTAPGGSSGGSTGGSSSPSPSKGGGGEISVAELLALCGLGLVIRLAPAPHLPRRRRDAHTVGRKAPTST